MKIVLALAFLAVAAYAQRPCAVPFQVTFGASQWEVDESYYANYQGSYDRHNSRTAYLEVIEQASIKDYFRYIFLHRDHVGYQYSVKRKQCRRFNIGDFRNWEVPAGAKYLGEFEIGGPGETVTVDQWSDETPSARETWLGDFSLLNCYPVNQFLLNAKDFNKTLIAHYYDVINGIVNPNVFDVPPECQQAVLENYMPIEARKVYSISSKTMI